MLVDRPVDWGQNQRVNSLVGRPVSQPRPDPESKLSGSVNRAVDRPKAKVAVHVLCIPVDRPSSDPVDWSVDRQQAQDWVLGFKNLVF